ncbi:hypothetical protein FNV43_RR09596 [Rhamnella rubrinervis]|uniref:Legume lectin domain-containing protein n=1 Tax=Rhamnella rubrinervis TaxID=2594499 RepID=A0A8K0MKI4_9ROSA|nr:hypothetical protein FNV43_RR09596 [Rhamnella rubrinervis]
MAALPISRHFPIFYAVLFFCFRASAGDSNSSFSFVEFGKDPKLVSNIAFMGMQRSLMARVSVQLTNSVSSSAGRVMYKKPIKLVEGKPQKLVSFSTYFLFSVSPGNGDSLAFVMFGIAKVSNTSTINLALTNGNKSHAWIDYEAGSRRLEVRLSQLGISCPRSIILVPN